MIAWAVLAALALGAIQTGKTPPAKIILDTDIGDDIDDAYALALLSVQRNIDLLGVTTVYGPTAKRAQIAAKILARCGLTNIGVYAGRSGEGPLTDQYLWAEGFQSKQLKKKSAATYLHEQLCKFPGEITILAIGPLTNLADLLDRHPDDARLIKRLVIMGGSVKIGFNGSAPPIPEHNFECDIPAAKKVMASGIPMTMAPLDATCNLFLDQARMKRLVAAGTPLTDALAALTRLWPHPIPILHDPLAAACALGHCFSDQEEDRIVIDDRGMSLVEAGAPNCLVYMATRADEFLDWFVDQIRNADKR